MDKLTAKLLLNYLYGRLGMNPNIVHSGVLKKKKHLIF